jgi:hypothetical protein
MLTITDFPMFCLWVFCVVDEWLKSQPMSKRRGPAPTTCSDSELLTMILVGECLGWDIETEMWWFWRQRPDLFPRIPSLSRFHRRRRLLAGHMQALHQELLRRMHWADDRITVIDAFPVAVVSRAHAPHARGDWAVHEAAYGYSHTKRLAFYGYNLHVLISYIGVVLDCVLVSPTVSDVAAGEDLLTHTAVDLHGRLALADKGFTSQPARERLQLERGVSLTVLPKRTMRSASAYPLATRRRFAHMRQRVETVNSQLTQQFGIQRTSAHSFEGLVTRLRSKLVAHVMCVYLNYCCGEPPERALHIKRLAFAG